MILKRFQLEPVRLSWLGQSGSTKQWGSCRIWFWGLLIFALLFSWRPSFAKIPLTQKVQRNFYCVPLNESQLSCFEGLDESRTEGMQYRLSFNWKGQQRRNPMRELDLFSWAMFYHLSCEIKGEVVGSWAVAKLDEELSQQAGFLESRVRSAHEVELTLKVPALPKMQPKCVLHSDHPRFSGPNSAWSGVYGNVRAEAYPIEYSSREMLDVRRMWYGRPQTAGKTCGCIARRDHGSLVTQCQSGSKSVFILGYGLARQERILALLNTVGVALETAKREDLESAAKALALNQALRDHGYTQLHHYAGIEAELNRSEHSYLYGVEGGLDQLRVMKQSVEEIRADFDPEQLVLQGYRFDIHRQLQLYHLGPIFYQMLHQGLDPDAIAPLGSDQLLRRRNLLQIQASTMGQNLLIQLQPLSYSHPLLYEKILYSFTALDDLIPITLEDKANYWGRRQKFMANFAQPDIFSANTQQWAREYADLKWDHYQTLLEQNEIAVEQLQARPESFIFPLPVERQAGFIESWLARCKLQPKSQNKN